MLTRLKTKQLFPALFISTGVFAVVGALYTWGAGPLWDQTSLTAVLIPWGDLMITGPLSLLAGYCLLKQKKWGNILGLMTCGIYVFGSALVYTALAWEGAPYPLHLALPPLAGLLIGIGFPVWLSRRYPVGIPEKETRSAPNLKPSLGEAVPDELPCRGSLNLGFNPLQEPRI